MRLYEPFEKWKQGGVIWVFSDPHFGDEDCKLMDKNWISPDEQVARINAKVGKKDTLIILGDVGNVEYVKKLKGYKVLVMGNHDAGATNFKRVITEEAIDLEVLYRADLRRPEVVYNDETIELRNNLLNEYRRNLLNEYKKKPNFSHLTDIYEGGFCHCYAKAVFDNHLFDEVYEGILAIGPDMILSHEPLNLPFGINIHGHDHAGKPVKKGAHSISFNMAANVVGYEPKRLDKLVEGAHYDGVHRLAIDKATEKKKKRAK